MQLSLSMSSVLHQALGSAINIVYQPLGNIFDHILFLAAKKHNFFIFHNQTTKYNTNNSIVLPAAHINFYDYNLWITNNPLACIDNNTNRIFHINSLIFLHQNKPQQIKKEDREIINKTLTSYNKLFFSQAYLSGWQLHNREKIISYAVPLDYISYMTKCTDRKKDILIVGDESNVIFPTLKQALSDKGYICELDNLSKPDLITINEAYNSYKIIIDLTATGWINCLCSVAAGCYVIHNTDQSVETTSIKKISSIEDVIAQSEHILQLYDTVDHLTRVQQDRQLIKKQYNFDLFCNQINTTIETLGKREVYIV